MRDRGKARVLGLVALLLLALVASGGVASAGVSAGTAAAAKTAVKHGAAAKSGVRRQAPARRQAAAKQRAQARKQRAQARKRAAARRRQAARRKQAAKQQAAAAAATTIPVTFTVRNTNTSMVPCPADGKTYEVKGHIVGPAGKLAAASGPRAAALYVHGLAYGEYFWEYKGLPGYDYATRQATDRGLISVTIDRLGYGASGRPDGNQVCYGSEADYLNQIVTQLRSGRYGAGTAATGPAFGRIALVGHSAGGFMVEASAASYRNVDALITAAFSNAPLGPPIYTAFAQTTLDCYTAPLPNNYAFFGRTAEDFRAGHFFNAEQDITDAITAIRVPDPCGDTGTAIPSVVVDVIANNTIKVPTLIVTGGNDALFAPPGGELEKALFVGNADLTQVTIPQTGHAITLGRTAPQFRAVLGDWLKGRGF